MASTLCWSFFGLTLALFDDRESGAEHGNVYRCIVCLMAGFYSPLQGAHGLKGNEGPHGPPGPAVSTTQCPLMQCNIQYHSAVYIANRASSLKTLLLPLPM